MEASELRACYDWPLTISIPVIAEILRDHNISATPLNITAGFVLGMMREADHEEHIQAIAVLLPIVRRELEFAPSG